jgi:superfamily II DNA or RNA helicase
MTTPASGKAKKKAKPGVSRTHKPDGMSLEQWQQELRKQFGRGQKFRVKRLGDDPVFTDFAVTNPQSGNTYRVTVRGPGTGDNTCTCPDFVTNSLGTCKHVEFVVGKLEANRKTAPRLKAGFHPPYSEVFLQYGSQREVRFRPGGDCPPQVVRLAATFFAADGLKQADTIDDFLTACAEADHEVRCGDDVRAYLAEVRDAEQRRAKVAAEFPRGVKSAAFKSLLGVPLYEYQREGALFAAKAGRCLIADEMGLGKTIQAIAAAEIMARLFGVERVLIVCPTSLKHQWQREIEKFSGRAAAVIGGGHLRRAAGFDDPAPFFKITNYDTVHHDLEKITAWGPDLVILDEAQRIKNWATRTARSVKKVQSPYAIVLTGTPLENRLEELVSIVQFVDRFRLGPTFKLLDAHQVRDDVGKVTGYRDLDQLGATLAPILLRRKKDQVLDQLPERIESTVFVPMTPQQRELHEQAREAVARIVAKWRRFKFLSEADKQRLMAALQTMRMACDSTHLIDPTTDHGPKAGEVATLLGELLETPGAKVVVFSQWVRMHHLLMRRLKAMKTGSVFFHGGVPGHKRKHLTDRFRDDPACRVFLSTDAGGVGLNLQHASAVINVDLPWNPAVLEQRIGRVHRLGQQNPVRVVNFVTQGAIEEGMLSLLAFKKSVFSGVLDGGAKDVSMGGSRMTKFMESVETVSTAIPAADPQEEAPQPEATAEVPDNPFAALLEVGAALLKQATAKPGADGKGGLIHTDAATGESYLKLPVPKPEVLKQLTAGLAGLLAALTGKSGDESSQG